MAWDGLKFTALEDSCTISGNFNGIILAEIEYSLDDGLTWNELDSETSVTLNINKSMLVRNNKSTLSSTGYDYFNFVMVGEGKIEASGNINSMINFGQLTSMCYYRLFINCTSLISAPELPATTLAIDCYYSMFQGCTSLISTPKLPATTLANYCYRSMFQGCESLIKAPELPATTLAIDCYYSMFQNCKALIEAPKLPATTLADYCYNSMFYSCTSLTTAPSLPATTLAYGCYESMFYGCTGLTLIQENLLSAETIAARCYANMFYGCTGLTSLPINLLPATTLKDSCYMSMFHSCNKLTSALKLPATTLTNNCYRSMFQDCNKLRIYTYANISDDNKIFNCPSIEKTISDSVSNMFSGTSGTFIGTPETGTSYYWYNNELKFTAITDSTIGYEINGDIVVDVEYSLDDGSTWNKWNGDEINLKFNESMLVRNKISFVSHTADEYFKFIMNDDGKIKASGNIDSINDLCKLTDYCYNKIFNDCISLIVAPELPATTLAEGCYANMFNGCISLIKAPELNTKDLANSCYQYMFQGCRSLTAAPELPATSLANSCYRYMFQGCISLIEAPKLPATTLIDYCYMDMFKDCKGLKKVPKIDITKLANKCCQEMFQGCTSLRVYTGMTIPDDNKFFTCPDTSEVVDAVKCMFENTGGNCNTTPKSGTSYYIYEDELKFIAVTNSTIGYKINGSFSHSINIEYSLDDGTTWTSWDGAKIDLSTNESIIVRNKESVLSDKEACYFYFIITGKIKASGNINSMRNFSSLGPSCYQNLFNNCNSLAEAPELPSTTIADRCYYSMFSGCTNLTTAPELPAKTLTACCYQEMFKNCISLTKAPELDATTLASNCYMTMFSGCTNLIETPELPATNLEADCYNAMFEGCISLTETPNLLASIIPDNCYNAMFESCVSLTKINTFNAENLNSNSCNSMFKNCISLKEIPELKIETLANNSCKSMFEGCTKLKVTDTKVDKYQILFFTCPSTSGLTDSVTNMFSGTSGTYTKDPISDKDYYYEISWARKIKLDSKLFKVKYAREYSGEFLPSYDGIILENTINDEEAMINLYGKVGCWSKICTNDFYNTWFRQDTILEISLPTTLNTIPGMMISNFSTPTKEIFCKYTNLDSSNVEILNASESGYDEGHLLWKNDYQFYYTGSNDNLIKYTGMIVQTVNNKLSGNWNELSYESGILVGQYEYTGTSESGLNNSYVGMIVSNTCGGNITDYYGDENGKIISEDNWKLLDDTNGVYQYIRLK